MDTQFVEKHEIDPGRIFNGQTVRKWKTLTSAPIRPSILGKPFRPFYITKVVFTNGEFAYVNMFQ